MNASTSDYTSGCESGWTMYLDQNSYNSDPYTTDFYTRYEHKGGYDDDDEDQSMGESGTKKRLGFFKSSTKGKSGDLKLDVFT
ncbi:hypothetical protein SASPL_115548 [Salvia splendens]|uniref:Uncharacterized protein n=1 Tax=Salvia splendens TaxID=180675 RepID=A0A8X8Y5P8_SALSN|nr:hypothetical protein SASPL_115548 [Salvia splendens]